MEIPAGGSSEPSAIPARSSSRLNQPASESSSPSTAISAPPSRSSARARKPSIRLAGNGQGWLAT